MVYIWLVLGFVCLVGGANFFVEGASGVARKLNVPSVVIGLTIVAFGTSAPEAAVSIDAALKGSNAIALNNVIGSNIYHQTCTKQKECIVYSHNFRTYRIKYR